MLDSKKEAEWVVARAFAPLDLVFSVVFTVLSVAWVALDVADVLPRSFAGPAAVMGWLAGISLCSWWKGRKA